MTRISYKKICNDILKIAKKNKVDYRDIMRDWIVAHEKLNITEEDLK